MRGALVATRLLYSEHCSSHSVYRVVINLKQVSARVQWLIEAVRERKITLTSARERAARGAAYLDDGHRSWYRLVNEETLDLGNGNACVLAQLYGSFARGLHGSQLINASSAPHPFISPVHLGLLAVQGVCEALQEQDYDYLNQAWQEEINRRRERYRMTVLPPFIEMSVTEPTFLN